ncbi:MAG TPA: DUF4915 domain-containing protein, partial [Spirochaetes bacterium]|nr:DUF4915 domain-containing protein [Spirochaetota bacterium]
MVVALLYGPVTPKVPSFAAPVQNPFGLTATYGYTFLAVADLDGDGDMERMAVAEMNEVVVLANSPGLAPLYPKQPDTYDGFYTPRATYYTGRVDIHGLAWGEEGLWGVITSFSCLALIDDSFSFIPKWKPSFIKELASEDRCHLNGMAMSEGVPLYVTA